MAGAKEASGGGGPFGFLSRRRFLKWGLGGGTLLLMGGGGGLWALRGKAEPVSGLRLLSPHEYRTMASLARTQFPRGGAFPEGADDFDLARAFDGFLADEPPENVRDLKLALFLMEYGPVLFERRLTTFSNLEPDAQLEHWQGWMTSDTLLRRQVSVAFRKFLSLVFFDQPAVWKHIGYGGPSWGKSE